MARLLSLPARALLAWLLDLCGFLSPALDKNNAGKRLRLRTEKSASLTALYSSSRQRNNFSRSEIVVA